MKDETKQHRHTYYMGGKKQREALIEQKAKALATQRAKRQRLRAVSAENRAAFRAANATLVAIAVGGAK